MPEGKVPVSPAQTETRMAGVAPANSHAFVRSLAFYAFAVARALTRLFRRLL